MISGVATHEKTDRTLTNAPPPLRSSTGANACVIETRPR